MMDPLEGTTLDLIHRRRVSTFYPGYAIILLVVGIIVALPLVKVDVVSTSGGMIRPCQEPAELYASIAGIVDSCLLMDHLRVNEGDTLVWIRKNLPEARMDELAQQIGRKMAFIRDIERILRGGLPLESSRYKQSFRNQGASCKRLRLQRDFLKDEYEAALKLHEQQVIPSREFEQARTEYMVACAQLDDHMEAYRTSLEDVLNQLWIETRQMKGEREELKVSLQNYTILAPITGTLNQCKGIRDGSVIQPGVAIGSISPMGELAADCYVETRDIREIRTGMRVKIRLDGKSRQAGDRIEARVSHIDPDVMLINGRPLYRVRCLMEITEELIPGMTFSASMVLYRSSIVSLLTEKLNRHFNPSLANQYPKLP